MNWQPQPGTEAITSWINQGALFALVLAVAAVVVCAATWAVGSLAANGSVPPDHNEQDPRMTTMVVADGAQDWFSDYVLKRIAAGCRRDDSPDDGAQGDRGPGRCATDVSRA